MNSTTNGASASLIFYCLNCGHEDDEETCASCGSSHVYEKKFAWELILECQRAFTSRVEAVARILNYGAEHISYECDTVSLEWYEYCRGHAYHQSASFPVKYLSMTEEEIKESEKERKGK